MPYDVLPGGMIVACPACGRQAIIGVEELGTTITHSPRRCPQRRECGESFLVRQNLSGYEYRGKFIGR